jgi:hypothetical protein
MRITWVSREEVPGRNVLSQEQQNSNNTFAKYASGDS